MTSALLLRTDIVKKLGRLDQRFFIFFSDVDYCKRIYDHSLGIVFAPAAQAVHLLGGSTRQEGNWLLYDSHRGFYLYLVKHELTGPRTLLRPPALTLLTWSALIRDLWRRLNRRLF
jgi:hypothetical protein